MNQIVPCAILLAVLGFTGGCGSDPFCGDNNTDPGEQCDDGNSDDTDFCLSTCLVRPTRDLTVKWDFNADESRGFSGDACIDVDVRTVAVDLSGPTASSEVGECSVRQVVFRDLDAGMYTASILPQDGGGSAVANGSQDTIEIGDFGDYELEVVVSPGAWLSGFDGNMFFRVEWGGEGVGCAAAGVVQQTLTLTRDGAPLGSVTKAGDLLDGTPGPCRDIGDAEPQTVLDLEFGPATLVIEGLDAEAAVIYRTSFETFVGAGTNNPEFRFRPEMTPTPE